ncbi:protein of unknown function [Allopseudospirillum japonicum]|uniref:DUF4214 domain-containing protein n=1 Tax=Allopseudospirillum japonicum TaxID=64971 RepID=A0A1H6R5Y2_9GAMM|nr:methyltransferase domain-containing protein [Allopseudospirillum japonicum]SEI46602.1 protein of unknown function [Allopseudospirillum japonicum]
MQDLDLTCLFSYQDEDFILQAYLHLLGREPDPQGLADYLHALRSGHYPKWRILAALASSAEFKAQHPQPPKVLKGYIRKHKLLKLPGVATCARVLQLWRLPQQLAATRAEIERLQVLQERKRLWSPEAQAPDLHVCITEKSQLAQQRQRALGAQNKEAWLQYLTSLEANQDALMQALALQRQQHGRLKTDLMRQISMRALQEHLQSVQDQLNQKIAELRDHLEQKIDRMSAQDQQALKRQLDGLTYQVTSLRQGLSAPACTETENTTHHTSQQTDPTPQALDALYLALEDKFRGSQQAVHQHLKIHLQHIDNLKSQQTSLRIADIGCGRGEWVAQCQAAGHQVIGVDMNASMVQSLQDQGLTGVLADGIQWLQTQPAASLDVVTGFHIAEHLEFTTLITFIDAAWHALTDQGYLILETPNPENLVVGAYSFYLDPTHKNPIPPLTLEFLLQARGFTQTQIIRLNPRQEVDTSPLAEHWFTTATDYAIYACKSQSQAQILEDTQA